MAATLGTLLAGVRIRGGLRKELARVPVAGLEYDSRRVKKDFVFFAFRGAKVDGGEFAADALAKGACAVVSENPPPEGFRGPWIKVDHGRRALATASSNFYNHPDRRVHFTGITGTNGKTTTSYVLEAILRAAGFTTGLLGTIEYRLANEVRAAPNTTPESLDVIRFATELEQRGGTHLVSEVSSHALALGRVWGFQFHTAVFTNLTQDHLDFHGTMEGYAAAKRFLFVPEEGPAPIWAVLNADDPASKAMEPSAPAQVIWYSIAPGRSARGKYPVRFRWLAL